MVAPTGSALRTAAPRSPPEPQQNPAVNGIDEAAPLGRG
jgi:hypothetical protein